MSNLELLFLFIFGTPVLLGLIYLIVANCFDNTPTVIYSEEEKQTMILSGMARDQWFANQERKRYYQELLDEAMLQTDILLKSMPDQLKKQWDSCDPPSLLRFLCKW